MRRTSPLLALALVSCSNLPSVPMLNGTNVGADLCAVETLFVDVYPQNVGLRLDDTLTISAAASTPAQCGYEISWSTSNSAAASVSTTGVVVAVGPGTTYIRASTQGKSDSTLITVTGAPIATLAIELRSVPIRVGEVVGALLVARDSAGNVLPIRRASWTSLDDRIARVGSSGHVFGVQPGSTTIQASAEGKSASVIARVIAK